MKSDDIEREIQRMIENRGGYKMNLRDPNSEKKREYREKQGWSDYKQFSAQQDTNGRTWVEDDNFTYDARMYIDGDFSSPEEKLEYAESVAMALNAAI